MKCDRKSTPRIVCMVNFKGMFYYQEFNSACSGEQIVVHNSLHDIDASEATCNSMENTVLGYRKN